MSLADAHELYDVLDRVLAEGALQAFCANPILLPDEIEDIDSVDWVRAFSNAVAKMMAHVGLEDRRIDLQAYTLDPSSDDLFDMHGKVPEDQPFEPVRAGALVEYAGTDGDTSTFVFDHRCTASADRMLAATALAVTEAYRAAETDIELDEQDMQNEVWATCLGFGVLLTNGSHVVETWSESQVSVTRTSRLGYFGPPEHVHLLALKVGALRPNEDRTGAIRSALRPNARGPFDDLMAGEGLLDELELPPRSQWPRAALAVPLRSDVGRRVTVSRSVDAHREAIRAASKKEREGLPVFRVREYQPAFMIFLWAMFGILVGGIVAAATTPAAGFVGLLIPLGAVAVDRSRVRYKCSNPTCVDVLEVGAETCPECGGLLVGEIASPDERLEAEEAWFEAHPEVSRTDESVGAVEARDDDSPLFAASQRGSYADVPADLDVLLAVSAEDPEEIGQFELTSGEICLFVFTAPSRFADWANGQAEFETREILWVDLVATASGNGVALMINPGTDPVVIRAFDVATLF